MSEAKTATSTELPKLAPPVIDYAKVTPEAAVMQLIRYAVDSGASDLFFAANENMTGVQVRQLGIVRSIGAIPAEAGKRCLAYVKANAGLDTSEKRRPLDGRWIFDDGGRRGKVGRVDGAVDLRINVIPTMHGEDFAIRLLSRNSELFVLDKLGMEGQQLDEFKAMLESPSGLILITGPTGSGKTATLYASLARLNNGARKINTIEDPVEYAVEGLRQSQVHPAIGLGFSELLRSVLRQSPDVIMIGEIRDAETAQIAVHAANSGVLVFATLHAATAPGAIQSIRSLGTHPHFLATSLRGVVAQRLVRTLCPRCRVTFDLSDAPHTFDDVRKWLTPDEGRVLYAPVGCPACAMTGYAGRTAVFEFMAVTGPLRELMAEGRPVQEVREKAVAEGLIEFRQAALLKVAKGFTSTEEVFRVIPHEHLVYETSRAASDASSL